MVSLRKLCRRSFWITALLGVLFFLTVGGSSVRTFSLARRVRGILAQANAVRLVEYGAYNMQTHRNSEPLAEKIFNQKEFSRVTDALPFLGLCDSPACGFVPHHALICSLPDGRDITIRICLSCNGIQFDDEPYGDLAISWHHGFVSLLSDSGMPYRHRMTYGVEGDLPPEK